MSIIAQLNAVFCEVFDDPMIVIRPETEAADIPDWDSVAQVKLVLAIEELFSVRFASEELSEFHCVGDLVRALERRMGAHR